MSRYFVRLALTVLLLGLAAWFSGKDASAQGMFGSGGGTSGISIGNGASTQNIGSVGQVDSSARYVRGNQDASGFIGAADANAGFVGQVNADGGNSGRSGIGGGGNRGGNVNRAARPSSAEIRSALTVGFGFARPTNECQACILQRRIERSKWIDRTSPISVTFEGRTAIIVGSVADPHARDLIGRLAMLEPSIDEVNNQLVVDDEIDETIEERR